MLSEKLRGMSRAFAAKARGAEHVQISAEYAKVITSVLDGYANDAEALERTQLSAAARLSGHELPGNVVRLAVILDSGGVRTGATLPEGEAS